MSSPLTLVTGATGFVGSHAAAELVAAGHRVRCTVRPTSSLRWLEGLDVELVEADLGQAGRLRAALRGVGAVVHSAGLTRARDERDFETVNAGGTATLAREAVAAGVRRFVFVSSLAARGPDGADGPSSAYGRSKRDAERRLAELSGDLQIVVLRPAGVYGPRDTELFPLFRMAARGWLPLPAAPVLLQPIYVDDLARACRLSLEGDVGFGPHPLAERARYDWQEVADALERAAGRTVRRIPVPPACLQAVSWLAEVVGRATGKTVTFDRRNARDLSRNQWTCDPTGSMEALGWEPRIALPEGADHTIRWYREIGWIGRG